MPLFCDRCYNPMNIEKHLVKSSLRKLPEYLAIHYRLPTNDNRRVCVACYKKLKKDTADFSEESESFENDQNVNEEPIDVDESQDTNVTGSSSIFY